MILTLSTTVIIIISLALCILNYSEQEMSSTSQEGSIFRPWQ